jgi:hypothetical protein
MRTTCLFAIAFFAVVSIASSASARCLRYEPAQVSLVGELVAKAVPGPPNYTSVARGDLPETVHLLVLETPICVTGDRASQQNSRGETGVAEVQLVAKQGRLRSLVGKRVRATGTLSSAQSGHHRTPVLLTVKAIRAADPPAEVPKPSGG